MPILLLLIYEEHIKTLTVDSMTWIFSGVGIAIISFIIYLYKRYVRHIKFEPSMFVMGCESNQIALPLHVDKEVQARINALVAQEDKRLPSYQVHNLDPYKNPWLMMDDVSMKVKNQQHYMSQKEQYIKSYRAYQTNIIMQQDADAMMVPLKLMLKNEGRSEGTNIEIELTLKGMFYIEDNKVEKTSFKIKEPKNIGNHCNGIMLTSVEKDYYTYHIWDLKTPLASPIMIEKTQMNPKSTTKEPLAVLYVNTALANEGTIHYKIYASTLTDPVEGDIVVKVG